MNAVTVSSVHDASKTSLMFMCTGSATATLTRSLSSCSSSWSPTRAPSLSCTNRSTSQLPSSNTSTLP